ncbi:MAG: 4-(cytidine 5'-diphospho)-2-C-methyl-D-erythritol kinase, partial [Thermoanaerobaculia bacterium]
MENSKEFTVSLKSFCKINLFLKVISKRKDGFHNIFSYLMPISLYDEIYFEKIEEDRFEIETIGADIKKEENLVYRAGLVLKEYSKNKKGVKIKIIKNVPLGSGLGGGSSNCALTLNFLNKYWE